MVREVLTMAICRLCGREMGNEKEKHVCKEKYSRVICPGKYQCMICGNIQDYTGPCAHCGMPLDGGDEGRAE
ncbi:MAG: hypothetical protein GXX04_07905 [Clostridiaceae bacterium]|nr:hypothetical protein [Clostridiaceae bacterium]